MQLVERQSDAPGTTITIGPSIAVELSWALLAAERDQLRASHPALEALYADPSGLQRRVRSFWSDDVADFGEQIVLADQAAALASMDIDELLGAVAEAAAHSPKELRLASEDGPDRLVFLQRLDRLRRSARLRRDYLQLLSDLWSGLAATWDSSGRPLVELAAERLRRRIEQDGRWLEVVVAESEHLSALLPGLVVRVAPVRAVRIAPSFFSGQGLLFDLPGGILVGVRASSTDPSTRAKTDLVARRLKALSDPTRLAIAHGLAEGPLTVGEIARVFDLAQPTVSNHVKVLREAGVVTGTRRGTRVELELRADAANELLDELRSLLNRSPAPGGRAN